MNLFQPWRNYFYFNPAHMELCIILPLAIYFWNSKPNHKVLHKSFNNLTNISSGINLTTCISNNGLSFTYQIVISQLNMMNHAERLGKYLAQPTKIRNKGIIDNMTHKSYSVLISTATTLMNHPPLATCYFTDSF